MRTRSVSIFDDTNFDVARAYKQLIYNHIFSTQVRAIYAIGHRYRSADFPLDLYDVLRRTGCRKFGSEVSVFAVLNNRPFCQVPKKDIESTEC